MPKQVGNNQGETEFLNSGYGVTNKSTVTEFKWTIDPNGVLGKKLAEAKRRSRVVRELAIVALTKKRPGITPWVVLANVKTMEILHLFMLMLPDVTKNDLATVLRRHLANESDIEKLYGFTRAELLKTAPSEINTAKNECPS